MSTRSGRSYKRMEEQQQDGGQPSQITSPQTQPDTTSLAQMVQAMLEDRRLREAEIAEERRSMREQIGALQRLVLDRPSAPHSTPAPETLRLSKLTDQDDIEAYLLTFERMMQAHHIDPAQWVFRLAPQLTGKAQQAYAALSTDESDKYDSVKKAILRRYNINEETYRRQFRGAKLRKGETPTEFATRLTDLARRWTKECSSVDELLDLLVHEQLINSLPEDVRLWVRERKPKTSTEAGALAEDFLQARATENEGRPRSNKDRQERRAPPGDCPRCGNPGHWASECPKYGTKADNKTVNNRSRKQEVQCFNCKEKGHMSYNCPKNTGLYCDVTTEPPQESTHQAIKEKEVYRRGRVNGIPVEDIVLDTGASRTLVREDLVPPQAIREGSSVTIRCAHGDTVTYPLAQISISVGSQQEMVVTAAVSRTLPASVLLGRDVPKLKELILGNGEEQPLQDPEPVLAVTTRAEAKRQLEREREEDLRLQTGKPKTSPVASPTIIQTQSPELLPFQFDGSLFTPGHDRPHRTRAEKRRERHEHFNNMTDSAATDEIPTSALDISIAELKALQATDPTLTDSWKAAREVSSLAGQTLHEKDGLLYRCYTPPGRSDQTIEQLVLPEKCRETVLRLAHNIPLAGHLGRNKTAKRILQRFYWPTVYRDAAKYCKACPECQKTSTRRTPRAPLIPLPIIEEPFSRIAMDIVGPLPRSRSGKRYILVICDYATRYPDAVALRSIDAECIADELIHFFARHGVPREILTDQGSNFTSQLLAELYRLLHVKPLRTTPYHPQTDGLVERFNQTLKAMLRKAATKEGKDWDTLLPYLLFAYREVPQASTGFSPFELIYGHQVRGPLDILRETWESSPKSSESIVSHVLSIHDKLDKLRSLVQENLAKAQDYQKAWYDKHARSHEFHQGDQVLVLLPTSKNKLLAEWQGPYPVIRRIGKVVYEVDMKGHRRRKRRFHVNMLREWVSLEDNAFTAEEIDPEMEEDDIILWERGETEPPTVNSGLTEQQAKDLQSLLQGFSKTLGPDPGRTSIAEHSIETENAQPVRLPPYRLPHAYRDAIDQELRDMEEAGIIEPSSSAWASPLLPVKKKDGTIRLCVDYRKLNSVSRRDAYPMPRIDDLIDDIGGAKFITTLDLAKGYWQVPVRETDRPKTAFTTPQGLYQFRVMPFGLQGAPATFQRMMDSLLRGLRKFTAAYLDDIVIFSTSWEEHLLHLRTVLQRLQEAKLTIKPKKCQFGMNSCTYLGHVVGNGGVCPEAAKVLAVDAFPQPQTKKQVRAFLGLAGYYRKFIPNFATIAAPLTDLTRRSSPTRVPWSPDCQHAFEQLKNSLRSFPILRSPDFSKPFLLQTDASDRGIGAVLSQTDDNGVEHAICFYSKKLLPREEKYATVEKECLAIKTAVDVFKVYLLGRRFTIQTDHRALEWLQNSREKNGRLTRWSLALQPYDFHIVYRKGPENGNADGLSRAFDDNDMLPNDCVAGEGRGSVKDSATHLHTYPYPSYTEPHPSLLEP